MITYTKYNHEKIKQEFRVISVDENGLTFSDWVEQGGVQEEIKKAELLKKKIVMVQATTDATIDFYRL